ncbi:MAG: HlyC/CorC family transporter [Proteobacteria bacterium]|nr:HlyC/CorC family transporter [Pseudomonadota bacterium]
MDTIPLSVLFIILFVLIVLSAFFSSSETGMMALNKYRLRHLVKDKHRAAILASKLLEKPDRLIGVILFGNNVVNFLAAAIAIVIGFRLLGNYGAAASPFIIAIIFIIFAETAPKTYAAIRPEKIAFPSAYILTPLLKLCYPIVYIINKISNTLLIPLGINTDNIEDKPLSQDELRMIVLEAGGAISSNHQNMLLGILDMEKVTVDDIMVPRNELVGIDLDDSVADILEQLTHCQHTRLIVYRENMDNVVGMLHVRRVLRILNRKTGFSLDELEKLTIEPYYLPEGTPLHTQMLKFQQRKRRTGLVVDEYGVVQGMVTLDDILEEIIGEFTTDIQTFNQDIQPQEDGSFFVDGGTTIRDINKQLDWDLPMGGPKTINGVILEHLENIPESGTSLRMESYIFEITQVVDNAVKKVKIFPLSNVSKTKED